MKTWFTRLLAAIFVVSLLITPQAQLFAETELVNPGDAIVEPGDGSGGDDLNLEEGNSASGDDGAESGEVGSGDSAEDSDEATTEEEAEEPADSDTDGGVDDAGDGNSDENPSGSSDGLDAGAGDDTELESPDGSESPELGENVDGSPTDETLDEDADNLIATSNDDLVAPAAISGSFTLNNPVYNVATGELTVSISLSETFSASAGDVWGVEWGGYGPVDLLMDMPDPFTHSDPDLEISMAAQWSAIRMTFDADYSGSGEIRFTVDTTLTIDDCEPSPVPYMRTMEMNLWLWDYQYSQYQHTSSYVEVGTECPGVADLEVDYLFYDLMDQKLGIGVMVPPHSEPGESITITYPADMMLVEPGPIPLIMRSDLLGTSVTAGEVTASNGVITVTITRAVDSGDFDGWAYVELKASLTVACEPGDVYLLEHEPFTLVASSGMEETFFQSETLCNAAPPSKTGSWVEGPDGLLIKWEIDTGDVLGPAEVYDEISDDSFYFLCDTFEIETVYPGVIWDGGDGDANGCDDYAGEWFWGDLFGADIVRARFTIYAMPNDAVAGNSFLNCAWIETDEYYGPVSTAVAQSASGLGGEVCYELFQPETGDFIAKSVDKASVESGETVTYTVTATTTTTQWETILVSDQLPSGFTLDPASITCDVSVAIHEGDPCYAVIDGTLYVAAHAMEEYDDDEGWYWNASPITITLKFSGKLQGAPGTVIVNEACSEREAAYYRDMVPQAVVNMGDPTIPGGGVICDTAETRIVAPPPGPSPSPTGTIVPTETATPTETVVPSETPDATPTSTATDDPDPTRAVTGLPETGSGDTGASALFVMAIAASLLVASAVGIRLRPRE